MDQASDLGDACCGQLVLREVRAIGPEDCRCGCAIEANKVEGLPCREQRMTGKHQIINQVDGCAGRQPFAGEPAITDLWVISVGDEVGLWSPPDEHCRYPELEGDGAGERPSALVTGGDGVSRWDGAGEMIDDEGEVVASGTSVLSR